MKSWARSVSGAAVDAPTWAVAVGAAFVGLVLVALLLGGATALVEWGYGIGLKDRVGCEVGR